MNSTITSIFFALTSAMVFGQSSVSWKKTSANSDFNNSNAWNKDQNGSGAANKPAPGVTANFDGPVSAQPIVSSDIITKDLQIFVAPDVASVTGTNIELNATQGKLSLEQGLTVEAGSSLEFIGTLDKSGSGSLEFAVDGTASFDGTISNSGNSVNLTGSGTTTLIDATVNSSITVGSGSTLAGVGSVGENLTLSNGTLSPGTTGTGTIRVTGNVDGSGTWVFDAVDASTRDLINVDGTLDVSGFDLNIAAPAQAAVNDRIVIANYGTGASAGQFSSITGLGGNWEMDYSTSGQIAIVAIVPEVTSIIPLSLAFLPLVTMRNRRSRGKILRTQAVAC